MGGSGVVTNGLTQAQCKLGESYISIPPQNEAMRRVSATCRTRQGVAVGCVEIQSRWADGEKGARHREGRLCVGLKKAVAMACVVFKKRTPKRPDEF